jgi:hypothetical protein
MKRLALCLALITLFVYTGLSQGNPAEWRKSGNQTWFKDFKTYNGFGTTNPTYPWHFIGAVYSNTSVTAPSGVFTALTVNGTALGTTLGAYVLMADSGGTAPGGYATPLDLSAKVNKADSNSTASGGYATRKFLLDTYAPLQDPTFSGKATVPVVVIGGVDTTSTGYAVGAMFLHMTEADTSVWIKIRNDGPIAARWKKLTP